MSKLPAEKDDLVSARSLPALLSLKEPALLHLKERYSESFAITPREREKQVHLFMIRAGLWALVRTFTPRDFAEKESRNLLDAALQTIEQAMKGNNPELLAQLDAAVEKARERVRKKAAGFKINI